ncbi:MAG: sensor histidine kinase [Halobacteriales archaeon]
MGGNRPQNHPSQPSGASSIRLRSLIGIVILGGLAMALIALQVAIVLDLQGDLQQVLLASILPITLALTMFIGGVGIYYYDLEEFSLRISGWAVFGMAAYLLAAWVGLVYFIPSGVSVASVDLRIGIFNLVASGGLLGFLVGIYDAHHRHVTHQLQAEHDRVTTLYQRLDVINRVLRHDLRNRVNVILGQASLLETFRERDVVEIGHEIRDAGEELITLSERTRQIAGLAPDQTATQPVDLAAMTRDVVTEIRSATDDETIRMECPDEVMVLAIPSIEVAIEELLGNSIEHAGTGNPGIDVSITVDTQWGGGEAELTIVDNGPGIPEAELAVIESGTETDLQHSSGLGLWIAKSIVDASNGELIFETDGKTGTTACIRLPLVE